MTSSSAIIIFSRTVRALKSTIYDINSEQHILPFPHVVEVRTRWKYVKNSSSILRCYIQDYTTMHPLKDVLYR